MSNNASQPSTPTKTMLPKEKVESLTQAVEIMDNKKERVQNTLTAISAHQAKMKDLYRAYYVAAADLHDTATTFRNDPVIYRLVKNFLTIPQESAIKYPYDPEKEMSKKRKL
jgi:vacuolar-type H+-ATPase subunit I/STV1